MTNLGDWLADQVSAIARPIVERATRDLLGRVRVDVTIRFHLDDEEI